MGYGHLGAAGLGHMAGGSFFGFGGLIFTFIATALIAGLVIWLIASRKNVPMPAHAAHYATYQEQSAMPMAGAAEDQALRIARERLAKGEIDAGQYTVIVNALKG